MHQIGLQTEERALTSQSGIVMCDVLWQLGRFEEALKTSNSFMPLAREINFALHIAVFLSVQSRVFSMKENYTEARAIADRILAFIDLTVPWGKKQYHLPFALLACALGDYQAQLHHIGELLEVNLSPPMSGRPGYTIVYLPLTLFWLEQTGQDEFVVSIMGLMANHSAESATRWAAKWPAYQRLRQRLEDSLGAEQFELAYEHGAELDLRETVEEVLALMKA